MKETSNKASPAYTLKLRGGADTYIKPDGTIGTAGKGALIQIEKSATLGVTQDQYLFVPLHGEIAPPIDGSYYKGCGERNGIEREVVAVKCKKVLNNDCTI